MAPHDLTPHLRTRLSRIEHAVGWFVLLAIVLLAGGFAYYLYTAAERKGWFVTKAPYYTFAERATGLKVGDGVKLMGFDVGQITRIDSMPPYHAFNVYVEFEIKAPYYGYLWTEGSVVKLAPADLFGQRTIEVTKGTKGYPIYMFNPLREMTLSEAERLHELGRFKLAEEIREPNGTTVLMPALSPLSKELLGKLAALGRNQIRLFDAREHKKTMAAVWNDFEKRYEPYARTNLYWLLADETPALSERMDRLVAQAENALPAFIALTNQLAAALQNAAVLASNMNTVAVLARPAASNLAAISQDLRGAGGLGQWLLSPTQQVQLDTALTNFNALMVNADTNLAALARSLAESLENLASITSNLNVQVQANTNILKSISDAVTNADEFVQGLKRHWLLRSAFKSKPPAQTVPQSKRLAAPRGKN